MNRQQITELRHKALDIHSEHDEILDLAIIIGHLCDIILDQFDAARATQKTVPQSHPQTPPPPTPKPNPNPAYDHLYHAGNVAYNDGFNLEHELHALFRRIKAAPVLVYPEHLAGYWSMFVRDAYEHGWEITTRRVVSLRVGQSDDDNDNRTSDA